MPDWLIPFVLAQAMAFVAWCVRVEIRLAELKGKTDGVSALQTGVTAIQVTLAAMTSDIKTLYRLVDGKHES